MADPTDTATTRRKIKASILPELMIEAFFAMAMRAGSAMVVEKPIKKAKSKSQNIEPFLAKSVASFSPTGKMPISSPRMKTASPKATMRSPKMIELRFSGTFEMINI